MSKHIVIVESPAKAKTIGKFLGDDYLITASYGHVRDLPSKKLGVDVENNFEPDYSILKDKSKIIINLLNKQKAHLSFDSHDSLILTGKNQITISKANSTLNLIHPLSHDFFEACRNKLGWSS